MFSVYGVRGREFTGSAEELRQVSSVNAAVRARLINPLSHDSPSPDWTAALKNAKEGPVSAAPLTAYAQTGQMHLPRHPLMLVSEMMNRNVFTIPLESTVLEAWQFLANRGAGQAPVVSASGFLVGLVSRADLLRPDRLPVPGESALIWQALLAQPVSEIMWTPIPGVEDGTDIRRVAQVLLDTGLPGLPVVDEEGTVTGFVSRTDILRAVVRDPPLDLWT